MKAFNICDLPKRYQDQISEKSLKDIIEKKKLENFDYEECEKETKNKEKNEYTIKKSRLDILNKTEWRFKKEFLDNDMEILMTFVQPPRLFELKGGGTYTPDFMTLNVDGKLHCYEVKGGYRGPGWEQGIERYKRVASQYASDFVKFTLANWDKKKNKWNLEEWTF